MRPKDLAPPFAAPLFKLAGASVVCEDGTIESGELWVGGEQVVKITSTTSSSSDLVPTIDCRGKILVPGLVDIHQHVTGGGGEKGWGSRCPEASVFELAEAGITTFCGVLGTDSVSRTLENLLAKVRGLAESGLTGFMYTGAYRLPPPTLCGSTLRDVMLIPEVIGIGEVAIADHRGSQPTVLELARYASEARVGGMLSDKAGVTYCHMGPQRGNQAFERPR